MKKTLCLTAGVALATLLASPAVAQMVPSPTPSPTSTPAPTPSPTASADIGDPSDLALVEGDVESVTRRMTPPPSPLAGNQAQRVTYVSRRYWTSRGWSNTEFDKRRVQSVNICKRIDYWQGEYADMFQQYRALDPQIDALAVRYDKDRKGIKRAGVIRTIMGVVSIPVGFATGGLGYAGLIGLGAASNEATGRASTNSQLTGNAAGKLNTDAMKLWLRASMVHIEVMSDYLDMMGSYCSNPAVMASFGADPSKGYASGIPQPTGYVDPPLTKKK